MLIEEINRVRSLNAQKMFVTLSLDQFGRGSSERCVEDVD